MKNNAIVWFRGQDLRLEDNPALCAAAGKSSVVPVFIWDPESEGRWPLGAASRWWLHHSLMSLQKELEARGTKLVIRRGNAIEQLSKLLSESHAKAIYWNRRYEPAMRQLDAKVIDAFPHIDTFSFSGNLLFEPTAILTKQGAPFKRFTPFWNACLNKSFDIHESIIPQLENHKLNGISIESLKLLPAINWDEGFYKVWQPGAANAKKQLEQFTKKVSKYTTDRDRPDLDGVSLLSPYLHFGEISPGMIVKTLKSLGTIADPYLRQLGWRDFAYHLLFHFPHTAEHALYPKEIPWVKDDTLLASWQTGLTGYPIVDAGMRQLWQTGWMHNRVRMTVASFLVKDLLISWQSGAAWFWDTLVDADLANNTMGWQWVAGCGADAAPYHRVFNPTLQGIKFDPEGEYVKKWVPELRQLPKKWIHTPWEAPIDCRANYPSPLVDHAEARLTYLKNLI